MVESSSDRLADLDDLAFESFVRRFAEAVWSGWDITVSPPSPDHGLDVRLSQATENRLLHVERRPAGSPVGAPAVCDLAALRDRRGLAGVVLASTSAITESARAVAANHGVGVLNADSLHRLCREVGVCLPDASRSERSDLDRAVETYAAYWPSSLAERTTELLDSIDGFAPFDHRVAVGDASTVVDLRVNGRALLKARLGETSVLVYVEGPAGFESVVRLSAYRETQPPLEKLLADLEPHVERALGRRF